MSEVTNVELSDRDLEAIAAGKSGGGRSGGGGGGLSNTLGTIERMQRISRNSTENAIRESQYRRSLGLRYGS